ncbi:MAG: hypothetical protein JNL26_10930 [Gemmatimonadetes bacterium]|nr:hypothetical protein [Gemmatimonadota bacterium]
MPSPGSRRWLERGATALGLAAMAAMALGAPDAPPLAVAHTRDLPGALRAATRRPVAALRIELDSLAGARDRAWVRALRRAGTVVSWGASRAISPLTVTVDPAGTPDGALAVRVLAPQGSRLRDAVGDLWRIDADDAIEGRAAPGTGLGVAAPSGVATPPAFEHVASPQRVRVVAAASWEGRFVAEALRGEGWEVETDFTVTAGAAPTGARTTTASARLDTATHAAVVLVGRAAPVPPGLAAFVRSGGGLVLLGDAASGPAVAALSPATVGPSLPPTLGALASATPRRGLRAWRLRPDPAAVALERRGADVVVAARRAALGRVLAVGYDESWRWRMEGPEGSVDAHAAWWSGLVASVTRGPGAWVSDGDPAPWAAWHAALGAPSAAPVLPVLARLDDRWLLAVALLSFLTGWLSRRLRGVP